MSAKDPAGATEGRTDLNPIAPHGAIALLPPACTACNICVAECPTWCISLAAHVEEQQPVGDPTAPGSGRPRGRTRKVKVLDAFAIDFGLCMFCGVCVEVCPFDALAWTPGPVVPRGAAAGLVEGIEQLGARWLT
ncbi:MAG: 4Fe-4S dicluster domain-containing protein [Candidatus Nanopelagicales bacterium]